MTAPAPNELERAVCDAAVLWCIDPECASALASLEDAVEAYLNARGQTLRPAGGVTPCQHAAAS